MTSHFGHQMQLTSLYQYWHPYSEQEFNQAFRQEVKRQIIKMLQDTSNLTDREMAFRLNYPDPNKVRPRRNELVKLGIVEEDTKRICNVGLKLSIAWRLNREKLLAYMGK